MSRLTRYVKVRLHPARKAVAKQLIAIYGTCATHPCIDCTCKH